MNTKKILKKKTLKKQQNGKNTWRHEKQENYKD